MRVSNPGRDEIFLFTNAYRKAVRPTLTSYSVGTRVYSQWERGQNVRLGHSSSCVEVRNEWSCTCAPPHVLL